jgi:hypothetical protein
LLDDKELGWLLMTVLEEKLDELLDGLEGGTVGPGPGTVGVWGWDTNELRPGALLEPLVKELKEGLDELLGGLERGAVGPGAVVWV